MTLCVATIVYYRAKRTTAFNPWLHLVIPVLGVAAFVPVLWYQFHPLPPYPLRYGNWGAIVLFAVSALVTVYMATQKRERMDANLLFVADTAQEGAPVVPTPV